MWQQREQLFAEGLTFLGIQREFLFSCQRHEPDYVESWSSGWKMSICKSLGGFTPKYEDLTRLQINMFLGIAEEMGLRSGDVLIGRDTAVKYRVLSVQDDRGEEKFIVETEEEAERGIGYLLLIPEVR